MKSMSKKGFILIEYLISLLVIILVLSIIVSCFSNLYKFDYELIQDEVMLYKLKRDLLIADIIEVTHDHISYSYQNNDYYLRMVNGNLIIQPGTQIVLNDLSELSFIDNGNISVKYCRNSCLTRVIIYE